MTLILNNSRDIGGKFTFGHWMMRNSDSQLPFIGPGYGRILYWPRSENLADVEKDMIEMKKAGLKAYAIQLTGPVRMDDKCWNCCKDDEIEPKFSEDTAATGSIEWPENPYGHYFGRDGTNAWYDEVKEKYKKLLKLCRKYNLWLLVFVVGYHVFDPESAENGGGARTLKKWLGWIRDFPDSPNWGGSSSQHGERPELSRRTELRRAIGGKDHYIFGFNGKANESEAEWGPTEEELHKLVDLILLPCGGQERVMVCPIDELPERWNSKVQVAKDFETWCIDKAKSKGFATCVYSESQDKKKARTFQGGHQDTVSEAKCEKGIGISDNDKMLINDLYPDSDPASEGSTDWEEYVYSIYKIDGDQKATVSKVETLISNYKKNKAKAGILYAINYGDGSNIDADKPAIKAISDCWKNPK